MMVEQFDLIVVGAGPGVMLSIRAKDRVGHMFQCRMYSI